MSSIQHQRQSSDHKRTTVKKVNERINEMGFELQYCKSGYYYFERISNSSPIIDEDGLYGSPFLNSWSVDEIVNILADRIFDNI